MTVIHEKWIGVGNVHFFIQLEIEILEQKRSFYV